MTCLKPGFVPRGWERGHAVCVDYKYGYVFGGIPIRGDITKPMDPLAIGRIDFRFYDEPDVKAWLEWWYAEVEGGAP